MSACAFEWNGGHDECGRDPGHAGPHEDPLSGNRWPIGIPWPAPPGQDARMAALCDAQVEEAARQTVLGMRVVANDVVPDDLVVLRSPGGPPAFIRVEEHRPLLTISLPDCMKAGALAAVDQLATADEDRARVVASSLEAAGAVLARAGVTTVRELRRALRVEDL